MALRPTEPALTDKRLRSLKCPAGETYREYRDGSRTNVYARVYPSGVVVLYYKYRSPFPKGAPAAQRPRRPMRLGEYPNEVTLGDLKHLIKTIDGQVESGVDPQGPPKEGKKGAPATRYRANRTPVRVDAAGQEERLAAILGPGPVLPGSFADLAKRYLLGHVWPSLRRPRDIEHALGARMVPAWRDLPASQIRRRDATELLSALKMASKLTAARRLRSYGHGVFAFGISEDLFDEDNRIEANPFAGIKGLGREQRRTDHLPEAQLRKLFKQLKARGTDFLVSSLALQMILFTAQRPGEVYGLRWSEVQGDWWVIPGGREGRAKNGLPNLVYLNRFAQDVLERLKPITGTSPYVFESRKTPGRPVTVTGMSGVYGDICRILDIPLEPKPFGPKGLQRTAITMLSELGVSDEIVDAIQNHIKPGVRKHYNLNQYRKEKKRAMLSLENRIVQILEASE